MNYKEWLKQMTAKRVSVSLSSMLQYKYFKILEMW